MSCHPSLLDVPEFEMSKESRGMGFFFQNEFVFPFGSFRSFLLILPSFFSCLNEIAFGHSGHAASGLMRNFPGSVASPGGVIKIRGFRTEKPEFRELVQLLLEESHRWPFGFA
jgi:hypothetical protein